MRAPEPTVLAFPPGFLWGSATAAHQVEGWNSNNDWWASEQAGQVPHRSGGACEQLHRYAEDFQLFAELGHQAHRLSIEWSRIEPEPGRFDSAALNHYRRVLESAREAGLEPLVTLHHFTNPQWVARAGGWSNPAVARRFVRFTRQVVAAYRDIVRYWITINEPTVYVSQGFMLGAWPPHLRRSWLGLRALRTMVTAHGLAYQAIHEAQPEAQVGLAHHWRLFDPARPERAADRRAARLRDWVSNRLVPLAVRTGRLLPPLGSGRRIASLVDTEDWVGVNYYTRERTRFVGRLPLEGFGQTVATPVERNHLGWEIYPQGLYRALRAAAPPGSGFRVIVTENGVPEPNDQDSLRPRYLVQHLAAMARAIQAGVRVDGYCYWSSLDNFEWAEGFAARFGLVHVDYETQERRPKPSAYLYRDIIQRNGLSAGDLEKFGGAAGPIGG